MLEMINPASNPATPTTGVGNANSQITAMQLVDQLKPIYKMIQTAKNPADVIQTICMQNPQFRSMFESAKTFAGTNPKAAFYEAARQRGINPDAILDALKG